ncbi:MAG: phenylalanine--tRNA ligase subunit beta [Candidatus Aquicultorales bacterium]
MLVPLSWLREYVEFDISPEELADRFDLTGTAIEEVHRLGEGLEKVVIGHVLECDRHPNADRLSVCKVDVGDGTPKQIVCGAPNVAAGQRVPVALPGASLPNGIVIGKAKLRGVESEGMICSETELKLGENAAGIMVLKESSEIGAPFTKVMGLDDVVLELEITPNRPDCLGIIGVAREVAAITGGRVTVSEVAVEESSLPISGRASVEILDADLCPRYEARVVLGIELGPSPLWMRQRLEKAGVRPISNIVDVTNYVMLETGQPLHAFDLDKLHESKIIVRRAAEGERMVTLDGVERLLSTEDLVIADASRAVAIAGIMGGEYSEVSHTTVNVLLEAAHFKPQSIMRTARKIGLLSEASARFEKGVDPNIIGFASDRAISLMKELAGGEVLKGAVDVYPAKIEPSVVSLRTERVNAILGTGLGSDEISGILEGLDLGVEKGRDGELNVTVPTFRFDLEREIDLIEEVARIYGYNTIESTLPESTGIRGGLSQEQKTVKAVKERLRANGLFEVTTYSFVDPGDVDMVNLPGDSPLKNGLKLLNPLSEEQSVMRTMLLPGLLKVVRHNAYREQPSVAIFEVSRVFRPVEGEIQPLEKGLVGIALSGSAGGGEWFASPRQYDFYDMKGIVADLMRSLDIRDWAVAPASDPRFHPGRSAELLIGGEPSGVFGEVHPAVIRNYDLPNAVIAAELDEDMLVQTAAASKLYSEIPRYPAIVLDQALIIDERTSNEEVVAVVKKAAGELLESVKPFDIFRGGSIPEGKKSVAYSMTYRSPERTLTDEEAKAAQADIVAALEKELGAVVRK